MTDLFISIIAILIFYVLLEIFIPIEPPSWFDNDEGES